MHNAHDINVAILISFTFCNLVEILELIDSHSKSWILHKLMKLNFTKVNDVNDR